MNVYVVEGPAGVVDVYQHELDAKVVAQEMLREGRWAKVTPKEVR